MMSLLLLAQFLAALLAASLALTGLRRLRDTRARRAAAFEDFAAGRGLTLYRTAAAWRLTDADGTRVTVEAPARASLPATVTIRLPGPQRHAGFVALVAGLAPDAGAACLDRALRGIAAGTDPAAVRLVPQPGAMALIAGGAPETAPDLALLRETLSQPALAPAAGATAMIALNRDGLHLRLTRRVAGPQDIGALMDAMRRLRLQLDDTARSEAA